MIDTQIFNADFADHYDFVEFVKATGLQTPVVGPAFSEFKRYSKLYVSLHGLGALSECFEAWNRTQIITS